MMPKKITLSVVGIDYRVAAYEQRAMNAMAPFKVVIEREPDNFQDPNALKVVIQDKSMKYNGMHIGYLTRQVASEWSPVMDKGKLKISEAWVTAVGDGKGEALLTVTGLSKSLQSRSAITP
jgi:HIRAN domain